MTEYTDLNKSYGVDSRLPVVYDVEAINEAIDNLITTQVGERVFNRKLGSRLAQILFEPMTDSIVQDTIMQIHQVMIKFEPRIKINLNSSSIKTDVDNHQVDVFLQYTIVSTNQLGAFSKTIRY